MKVLFAYDSGSNCNYLGRMLDLQTSMFKDFEYTFVRLPHYIHSNQDGYDILIYQTFPDETHPFKFNADMVKQGDEKFWEFKGIKVLMDSFDNGQKDGFSRMGEASLILPRIKSVPAWSFIKEFKVIFSVPPYLGVDSIEDIEDEKRDIVLHCAFNVGIYSHKIRETILDILHKEFSKEGNFTRISRKSYSNFLKRVQISVTAPGFGPCSNAFYTALQYGALSFAEETVDHHKLVPRVDLISGEDYISFSLDTLADKLRYLLKNPDECDQIRKSGHRKLQEGYNLEKSAKDFHITLENLCNSSTEGKT